MARALLGALLLVLAGAFIAPASAAPSKVDSSPQDGEELHEAPERVSISFDQPLDPESYIEVTNHCDERVDEQPTQVEGTEMSVPVTGNWAGMYHVTYVAKGIGGVTGQQTGTFTFTVHAGEACDGGEGGHHHGGKGGNQGSGHEGSGHEGSGEHSSGAGNHGMHGGTHPAGTHESAAHRGTTHSSTHDTHASMDHGSTHTGGRHGKHAAHRSNDSQDGAARHITSAPSGGLQGPGRDAAILSLALCALVGLFGGAVLRFSAPK
jgi:methionine-rich copper-binding protein CopC